MMSWGDFRISPSYRLCPHSEQVIFCGILDPLDKWAKTEIKALLKPKPLDEIRDPRERFDNVKEVHAASGIKILSPDLEKVIPGAPIRVVQNNIDKIISEIKDQTKIDLELDEQGIIIKADTIGSLEALIKESKDKSIQIRKAEIGNVSKRDVIEANTTTDQLNKVIFAFNVKILPEAKEELLNNDLKVFIGRKKIMNYVMAAMMNLDAGKQCVLMARGRSISRAVDVAEILINKFARGSSYGDIRIATEELKNEDGSKSNVSSIEIEINPPQK